MKKPIFVAMLMHYLLSNGSFRESYLYQQDTPEKMKDTLELWELFRQGRYEVYISDIVLKEISGCSQEKLDILLDYLMLNNVEG